MERVSPSIATIAEDTQSGAAEIAIRAADLMLQRANAGQAPSPDGFRQEMLETGWSIIQAQEVMAPLVNLVNLILWKIEERETMTGLRDAVADTVRTFKRQLKQHALQVAEETLSLITEHCTIITISQSSTVQRALIHAQHARRHFTVICAESQPGGEGQESVDALVQAGISAQLVSDQQAVDAVKHADLVLVGADLLSSKGLINKVGTLRLAEEAAGYNIPFHSLCTSAKFLPLGYPTPTKRLLLPRDHWPVDAAQMGAENRYFDLTPLDKIADIVTERGILPPVAFEAWLAATRLHPALAQRAEQMASLNSN